jgi:SAM-dependent methyltransferase
MDSPVRTMWRKAADRLRPAGMRYAPAQVASALYRAILDRPADSGGLQNLTRLLEAGTPIEEVARIMLSSSEFSLNMMKRLIPPRTLPDLVALHPERFERETAANGVDVLLFKADSDADFAFLEEAISRYRYYDEPGVWSAKIGLDHQITAAIVQGLGASNCLELGCFTGAVISLLEEAGLDVTGLDVSHLAFVLAYPNIKQHMVFGDLLTAQLAGPYDAVLAMDILEHLNPVKFDSYLDAIAALVAENGYFYLNAPMFGPDDVFGELFDTYATQWQQAGDTACWRRLHCEPDGWPMHGHLVWASPVWWERQFAARGMVRDRAIEHALHARLGPFFADNPARKSLFVLKHEGNTKAPAQVISAIHDALDKVADLPS